MNDLVKSGFPRCLHDEPELKFLKTGLAMQGCRSVDVPEFSLLEQIGMDTLRLPDVCHPFCIRRAEARGLFRSDQSHEFLF